MLGCIAVWSVVAKRVLFVAQLTILILGAPCLYLGRPNAWAGTLGTTDATLPFVVKCIRKV